jgi:hypothetical protein
MAHPWFVGLGTARLDLPGVLVAPPTPVGERRRGPFAGSLGTGQDRRRAGGTRRVTLWEAVSVALAGLAAGTINTVVG